MVTTGHKWTTHCQRWTKLGKSGQRWTKVAKGGQRPENCQIFRTRSDTDQAKKRLEKPRKLNEKRLKAHPIIKPKASGLSKLKTTDRQKVFLKNQNHASEKQKNNRQITPPHPSNGRDAASGTGKTKSKRRKIHYIMGLSIRCRGGKFTPRR